MALRLRRGTDAQRLTLDGVSIPVPAEGENSKKLRKQRSLAEGRTIPKRRLVYSRGRQKEKLTAEATKDKVQIRVRY